RPVPLSGGQALGERLRHLFVRRGPVTCRQHAKRYEEEMSRLLHYSSTPLVAIYSVSQEPPGSRYDKPNGLWVSVEGEMDWREWCVAESFGDPDSQLCYEVTLSPDANMLRLESPGDLLRFTNKYGVGPYLGPMAGRTVMFGLGIDWPEVASTYAGIIIAPYQWSMRLDDRVRWYYGWDCASGCVWDASAVSDLRLVTEP